MKPIQIISQDLFDKVRSRFQNLEMGDITGAVTIDPAEAVFFDFDFIYEGTNLGRVSISLNDLGSLKVYYSQGITENKDDFSKKIWYDFLKEMRLFAMRRLLRFDTRDITKSNLDKNDFQQLATTQGPKEDSNMKMNESRWNHRSTKKTSRAVKGQTEVIVRHTESMEEMAPGLRSHPKKIKAIFVQSREGERWKAPFNYPDLGFAMANHVDHGGVPHDPAGKAIVRMAEQIVQLGKFQKEIKQSTLHDDALKITEKAIGRLNELKAQIKALAKRHHYESWIAEFVEPEDTELNELDPVTLETYRSTFTASSFNENLAGLFPLIHSIMQEKIDLEEYVNESNNDTQMALNGRLIDRSSLEVDGVDRRDHPDYSDAYFSNADYADGTPLSDAELDQLTDMYGDVVNQMAYDNMYEGEGDEFAQFEQWAEAVETGTLAQDQVQALAAKLKEMQASGETLEFGPEGTTAFAFFQEYGINSEQLPDEVVNDLQEKLKQDAEDASFDDNADPMNTFKAWANEHQPDLVSQLGLSAAEPAAEPAPAEPAAEPAPVEQPVAEAKNDWIAEVAKLVKSRYNAANESVGPFNGIEGIALDIKKRIAEKFGDKLGEKAELVAKQYMEQLMHQWESKHGKPAMQSTDDNDGLHIQRLKELIGNVKTKLESMVNSEESNQGIDKDKETKFHTDLDNLVHKTFGKRPEENPKEAMSQHAKGWEKYGPGMKELAKAGKAGASEKEMDRIRKKHDRYDEDLDLIRKLSGMAK